jgi:hypothetical protein
VSSNHSKASLWWRDVIGSGRISEGDDWFKSNVGCCVGDGKNIEFWKFKWFGNQPLCELFPALYAKEAIKDVMVCDRLFDQDSATSWYWNWLEPLSPNEDLLLDELKELFTGFSLCSNTADRWKWTPSTNGMFSVKSCYSLLLQFKQIDPLDENVLLAINKLWGNDVSSKISIFGWRLLLQRLPTRRALNRRGILLNPLDLNCILCFGHIEDASHLFFSCPFNKGVWEAVFMWLGKSISLNVEG